MKNFILGSVITLLFSVCVFLYVQNTSLSASLVTYRTDKELVNKEFQKVKEDYYIEQQNRDTNLLLVVFPILLAITSVMTFTGVREEFKSSLAIQKSTYENQISEYNKSIIHIKNLEGDLSFETAKNISKDFDLFKLQYSDKELIEVVELALISCEYYAKSIILKTDKSVKFENSVTNIIHSSLERLKELSDEQTTINLHSISLNRFITIKNNLEKVINEEGFKNLELFTTKISFPTLD